MSFKDENGLTFKSKEDRDRFYSRWNVGETFPEEDRVERENTNVVSFAKAKRIKAINGEYRKQKRGDNE